ncbi:MAG TPA: hypothetical protein VIV57_06085 [Anaeromyxobacter sp.]
MVNTVASFAAAAAAALAVASRADAAARKGRPPLDEVARDYVRLVLAIGQHRPDYVDAYFGPQELKVEADQAGKRPLADLAAEAGRLLHAAREARAAAALERRRRELLVAEIAAARAFVQALEGRRLSFDAEAKAYFGVSPPRERLARYERIAERVAHLLPGEGTVAERYARYREKLVVPKERIEAVFQAAASEARRRTLAHVRLPEGERFTLELVTGKPWGGYNWYRGGYESLIQVNTDLPFYVDKAIDLAAHEGYPGHHVFNVLREEKLARAKGWIEFTVYALFGPASVLAEGTGNHAVEMAFPGEERTGFERDVLFPLAGLDPAEAGRNAEIRRLLHDLRGAGIQTARAYLDGEMSAGEVMAWNVKYGLATPERAKKSIEFMDGYRSYVVNYGYGEDLVAAWVGRAGKDPERRWAAFVDLVSEPVVPSRLRAPAKRR